IVAKLRIGSQLVDGAGLGNSLGAVAAFPVFGRKGENLSGLLQGFIYSIAGRDDTRPVRERDAITAVRILVNEGDVMGHRMTPINLSANRLADRCFAPCRWASPALGAARLRSAALGDG